MFRRKQLLLRFIASEKLTSYNGRDTNVQDSL